jgi:pre-mRNA-splicing factor ATP-dependent RNA helicase DHX15/PRP43
MQKDSLCHEYCRGLSHHSTNQICDPGFVKIRTFKTSSGVEVLSTIPTSKSSARQRAGRAGREAPGECYRLYTEGSFHRLEENTLPEILRSNLSNVILVMKASGINDVTVFHLLDQPSPNLIRKGLEELYLLNALDGSGNITDEGRLAAECPLGPDLAHTLLESSRRGCVDEVIRIISMLSVDNVFPSDQRDVSALKPFIHRSGDHLTQCRSLMPSIAHDQKAKWRMQPMNEP